MRNMHIDRVAAVAVSDALVSSSLEDGPLSRYRALQSTGALAHDAAQELAAEKLQSLWKALKNGCVSDFPNRTRYGALQ